MIRQQLCIWILACVMAAPLLGQDDAEHLFRTDTVMVSKKVQIIGLPLIFYTPETSFGGGGGLQLFFNSSRDEYNLRVSNLFASAIYTANKQMMLNLKPQIYLYRGNVYLESDILYKIYPNSFWGIGGDTPESNLERYNMQSFIASVALLKRIPPMLNFGFEYSFEKHVMLETLAGGLLENGEIPGSKGATVAGLSFVLNFDDRDNIYSTVGGNYLTFKGGFSSRTFGADYSFNHYLLDLRKYLTLAGKHTLALQAYLNAQTGNIPFQSLAWLGGPERNRGFFKGRYMDESYLLLQSEFRWRFHPRLHLNGFASLGQVSNTIASVFDHPKFSGGIGIRYKILKSNPTLIRMDLGVNQYGETGIYFGVNEAF